MSAPCHGASQSRPWQSLKSDSKLGYRGHSRNLLLPRPPLPGIVYVSDNSGPCWDSCHSVAERHKRLVKGTAEKSAVLLQEATAHYMMSRASRLVTGSPLYAERKRIRALQSFSIPLMPELVWTQPLFPIPGSCVEVEGQRCQYGHLHLSSLTLQTQH